MLVAERESADFYETVPSGARRQGARRQARRQLGDQRTVRPSRTRKATDIAVLAGVGAQLAAILDLIGEGTISGKIAKDLFEIVWQEGGDPRALVETRGMKQVTDLGAIEKVVDDIIAANPDKVEQAKAKPQLVGWFIGQVMKSSRRQGQPAGGQRPPEVQARHLNQQRQ